MKITNRPACYGSHFISKQSAIAFMPDSNKLKNVLSNMDEDKWSITAFMPQERIICINIYNDSGNVSYVSISIPELSIKM